MARSERNADEFGDWAYDARQSLGLSADAVAKDLGYDRTTIVRAEGRQRSRQVERKLPALYARLAREQGITLPPAPGEKSAPTLPSPDLAALIAAMTRQTNAVTDLLEELRAEREARLALQQTVNDLARDLEAMAAGRRADAAMAGLSEGTTPSGPGAPPPAADAHANPAPGADR